MKFLLLTFACGAAYEIGCAFWVHYTEANRMVPAVCWSVFNCLVSVIGVFEAFRGARLLLALCLGFGVGTAIAIRIKRRLVPPACPECERVTSHSRAVVRAFARSLKSRPVSNDCERHNHHVPGYCPGCMTEEKDRDRT